MQAHDDTTRAAWLEQHPAAATWLCGYVRGPKSANAWRGTNGGADDEDDEAADDDEEQNCGVDEDEDAAALTRAKTMANDLNALLGGFMTAALSVAGTRDAECVGMWTFAADHLSEIRKKAHLPQWLAAWKPAAGGYTQHWDELVREERHFLLPAYALVSRKCRPMAVVPGQRLIGKQDALLCGSVQLTNTTLAECIMSSAAAAAAATGAAAFQALWQQRAQQRSRLLT